jgi:hypothetical protein
VASCHQAVAHKEIGGRRGRRRHVGDQVRRAAVRRPIHRGVEDVEGIFGPLRGVDLMRPQQRRPAGRRLIDDADFADDEVVFPVRRSAAGIKDEVGATAADGVTRAVAVGVEALIVRQVGMRQRCGQQPGGACEGNSR